MNWAQAIDPDFPFHARRPSVEVTAFHAPLKVESRRGDLRARILRTAAKGATLPELMECGGKPTSIKAMVGNMRSKGVLRVEGERRAYRYFVA